MVFRSAGEAGHWVCRFAITPLGSRRPTQTDDFFRRIYTRERSFNCHLVQEAIYYFCLNNGMSRADALEIQTQVPLTGRDNGDGNALSTESIIAQLNGVETKEAFVDWLHQNMDKFVGYGNVTAYEAQFGDYRHQATGTNGLLVQERRQLPSILDDETTGKKSKFKS